jgi:hypothetical protein
MLGIMGSFKRINYCREEAKSGRGGKLGEDLKT